MSEQSSDPGKLWLRLAALHDRLFAERNTAKLKQLVIRLGIAGFAIHLLLIFLARTLPHPPALIANVGENYLVAISTPFNFILFYEVTTMIGALHESPPGRSPTSLRLCRSSSYEMSSKTLPTPRRWSPSTG